MNDKICKRLNSILVIANGVICIMFSEELLYLLPVICALVIVIKGAVGTVRGIQNKDHISLDSKGLEQSIVLLALGIGMLIKQEKDLFIVGIFWGLHGLKKSSEYLNEAFYNHYRKKRYFTLLLKSVVEFVLSIMLIFDPYTNIGHHVVILGIELILDSVFELLPDREEQESL